MDNVFLKRLFRALLGALIYLALSSASLAQLTIDPGVSIDLIDPGRELEDRLERERREEEIQRFRSTDDIKPSLINPEDENTGPCVNIADIQLEGVTLLSEHQQFHLLENRFPGCLRRFHISQLMQSIDKAYVDEGHITARTYIPQQDIQTSGVLRLQVVEGVVEDVILTKNGEQQRARDLELQTAFPNVRGKYLNIRDFEQGLEQLNRQSSVSARMRLEPGAETGGSLVHIETQVKDRYRGTIGFDNLGSRSTGERQLRLQLGADGIFSANDVGSLIYVGSTNANAVNGAFSIPIGYNTLTASASLSDFLTPLSDISELLSNTRSYTLSVDRVINRNSTSINHLSAALAYRQSSRFINGTPLTPQNTTTIDVRWRNITNTEKARWSTEFGLRSGLPWFGGLTDLGPLGSDIPHAEFQAFDFAITRIGKSQKQGRWTTSLRGQIAPGFALLGNEQFSLGTQSTVRGFREPLLGADSGAALRIEGSLPLPKLSNLKAKFPEAIGKGYDELKRRSGLYVFTDLGGGYSYGVEEGRFAAGAGAGYRFFAQKAQFDIGVQLGLVDLAKESLNQGDTRITASLSYKLF